jgi:hypothetical protein
MNCLPCKLTPNKWIAALHFKPCNTKNSDIISLFCFVRHMKTTTLQFEKKSELLLFLETMETNTYELNRDHLQLSGILLEKEIELAKSAFAAILVDQKTIANGNKSLATDGKLTSNMFTRTVLHIFIYT